MDECYVIYAIHKHKETWEPKGMTIISCVDTEEKVHKYLNDLKGKYNAKYINGCTLYINDAHFPFLEYVSYQLAIRDL